MTAFFRKRQISPEYYFKRGMECFKREDYTWALESFDKAIEFFPNFGMTYYMRAEVYKKLGRTRESVWDCIRFLEMECKSSGTGSISLGPLDAAKMGIDIAGIDMPDFLGVLETAKGAINSARFELKRIKMQGEIISFGIPTLLEELMKGYSPDGNYDDAHFYFLALRWLENNSPEKRCYIGFVQLLLKNFDKATEEFEQAIVEDPANPNAYYFRGVALINRTKKTGDREFASRHLGAYSDFCQALENGFKWRICPECGYRTDITLNYCMLCGAQLLTNAILNDKKIDEIEFDKS